MPNATRASVTQKPAGVAVHRATSSSGQSSGTDTDNGPESGRQRRRRGKLKMQQRIEDLLAQNRCLMQLIDEILGRFVCQDEGPPAEIFDLFGDDAAVGTVEAAIQTDISVDWCRPDIFVTLPPTTDGHATAQCTAHADAAAGHAPQSTRQEHDEGAKDFQSRDLPHTAVPLTKHRVARSNLADKCGPLPNCPPKVLFNASAHTSIYDEDFNSQHLAVQCGPLPYSPSALLGANAHTCSAIENFNSQDLAEQCGPLPHSPPHVLLDASAHTGNANSKDFTSLDPAVQSGPLPNSPSVLLGANAQTSSAHQKDFNSQDPLVTGQRQALDGDNSEHRCVSGNPNQGDFNSQDLAEQRGPSPNSPPIVLFDANSHDLAVQSGPLPHSPPVLLGANAQTSSASNELCQSSPWQEVIGTTAQLTSCLQSLTVHAARRAHQKDFYPQDQAKQCGPLPNSPPVVLFDASAHTRNANSEDFNSQDLAVQCGPLPNSPPVLFGANAHTCSAKEDYNSQDLAECLATASCVSQCGAEPQQAQFDATHYRLRDLASVSQDVGTWQALDDTNAKHQVPDVQNANQEDSYSHDLAEKCGPLPNSPPNVLFDANSHDLAVQSGPLPHSPSETTFRLQSLPAHVARRAHQKDSYPQDQAEQCGPFPNSPPFVLFNASARSRSANSEDFKSQDLAFQCGPLPNSPTVLFGANAQTCSAKEEFNSQDLAECSKDPNSLDLAQPRDFRDILDTILEVYGKKKKVTKKILSATARAIHRVACNHGVPKEVCIGLVKEHSLALTCAIDSLWSSP